MNKVNFKLSGVYLSIFYNVFNLYCYCICWYFIESFQYDSKS